MIVDSSALLAILLGEPDSEHFIEAIAQAADPRVGAASVLETAAVLIRRGVPELVEQLEALLESAGFEVVPLDARQARAAIAGYRAYGRGTGHPAALNLGDCYSYGLAQVAGQPLLFKGGDFNQTDVAVAVVVTG